MLRLVPFNPAWINHDKIDIKGIYRRPVYTQDDWGEPVRAHDADGLPLWDIVGPLPVKQHVNWTRKGFEFVTLAHKESLYAAARFGTLPAGSTIEDFDQHATGGPWNARKYHEGGRDADKMALAQLKTDIDRFGADAVEAIRRQTDPAFVLPDALKAPKGKKGAA
jgi:hypothetical protein